jgi:hypothetical protein
LIFLDVTEKVIKKNQTSSASIKDKSHTHSHSGSQVEVQVSIFGQRWPFNAPETGSVPASNHHPPPVDFYAICYFCNTYLLHDTSQCYTDSLPNLLSDAPADTPLYKIVASQSLAGLSATNEIPTLVASASWKWLSTLKAIRANLGDEIFAGHAIDVGVSLSNTSQSQSYSHSSNTCFSCAGIRRVPENGSVDPFNALPVAANPHIYSLLNHRMSQFLVFCKSPMLSCLFMLFLMLSKKRAKLDSSLVDQVVRHSRGLPGPREEWLSFAISDSAVLYMVLFIAALDIAGLRGTSSSPDILHWKGQTIRVINERLGNSNEAALGGTIAAVASLAHLEVSSDIVNPYRMP